EKFLDRLSTHHRDELAWKFLLELPEFLFSEKLAFLYGSVTRIDGDIRLEVKNALEFAQGHIQEVANAARETLEKPDMGAGARKLDMAEAFAPDFGQRDFHTAFVANDAAVFHAL